MGWQTNLWGMVRSQQALTLRRLGHQADALHPVNNRETIADEPSPAVLFKRVRSSVGPDAISSQVTTSSYLTKRSSAVKAVRLDDVVLGAVGELRNVFSAVRSNYKNIVFAIAPAPGCPLGIVSIGSIDTTIPGSSTVSMSPQFESRLTTVIMRQHSKRMAVAKASVFE